MSTRMTAAERAEFRDLVISQYAEGHSIRQIAVDTGRAYATVRRALIEAGAVIRDRGWTQARTP